MLAEKLSMSTNPAPQSPFAVGEIALFWRPDSCMHRREVTISSELRFDYVWDPLTGRTGYLWVHHIEHPGSTFHGDVAPLEFLRKRPQPPDWSQIAHKQDLLIHQPVKAPEPA